MIELTESLRQNIFVNLPIKLLCDLNCEGMDKNSKKKII